MYGILALSTVIVAVCLFFFANCKMKNGKWSIFLCCVAVLLLLPAALFLGIYVNEQEKAEERQDRKDIALYLKIEKVEDDESLVAWEYDRTKESVLIREVSTYKIIFVVKNKETGKEREEIIEVNGSDMNKVVSEARENNALKERLNEQTKE